MDENNKPAEFNAIVNEDEMIISIEEYKSMKERLEYYKGQESEQFNLRQRVRNENLELKSQLTKVQTENLVIKQGIINFIKGLGG